MVSINISCQNPLTILETSSYTSVIVYVFQVQLSEHRLHGGAWLLQLLELVRRASMVPARAYRRGYRVSWTYDYIRDYTLGSACLEHSYPYQRHLCVPGAGVQVEYHLSFHYYYITQFGPLTK